MTIIDEKLLATFRKPGKCEWCGKWCRLREPAHLWGRGHGGGRRLDVRINLVSLGSTLAFECQCHTDHHCGERPLLCDLLAVVAAREGVHQRHIEMAMMWLQRVPNRPIAGQVEAELRALRGEDRRLVREILKQREAA